MSVSPSPPLRRLLLLHSRPCNQSCADCGSRRPQCASITYGIFICLDCSRRHRTLGIHLSIVKSVFTDEWPDHHIRLMESNPGGNNALNAFLSARGVPARADIVLKYNSLAASLFRSRIDAIVHGQPWCDPTASPRPPRPIPSDDWDWDEEELTFEAGVGARKNQSIDFGAEGVEVAVAVAVGRPCRSWSSGDLMGLMQSRNGCTKGRSDKIRQGGRYVRIGSMNADADRGYLISGAVSAVSEGFGRFSVAASSAVHSAASAVQAGTKELASKVSEGEAVNVIAQKTTKLGQKTWGIMKDVMTVASQKVEEYAGEGAKWKSEGLEPQRSVESDSGPESPRSTSRQQDKGKHARTQSEDDWPRWE